MLQGEFVSSQVSTTNSEERLRELIGSGLECNRPLAPLTSYQTGGPARFFVTARNGEEIAAAIRSARTAGIPFFLIGGGSNLLVSDEGYDGLVIKVDVAGLRRIDQLTIESGAGEELMALVKFATQEGLSGLEFAAGIWGSVGGAIYGNAGAFGGEISQPLISLILVDSEGVLRTESPDYCRFRYRDSFLKVTREVVVSARFRLTASTPELIDQKVREILALRETKHPSALTAGCFFKNIPDPTQPYGKMPAGKLLEEAGAKELAVGGAKVFPKHANIIINSGTATSREIRRLADLMKSRVKEQFGIELQEEVQQLGRF